MCVQQKANCHMYYSQLKSIPEIKMSKSSARFGAAGAVAAPFALLMDAMLAEAPTAGASSFRHLWVIQRPSGDRQRWGACQPQRRGCMQQFCGCTAAACALGAQCHCDGVLSPPVPLNPLLPCSTLAVSPPPFPRPPPPPPSPQVGGPLPSRDGRLQRCSSSTRLTALSRTGGSRVSAPARAGPQAA